MARYTDLTGQRFGRLVVIRYLYTEQHRRTAVWLCKCSCGKETRVRTDSLTGGKTQSCGCLQSENAFNIGKDNIKHGLIHHRLYRIYNGMKARCLKPTSQAYKNYGGRGISICEEWEKSFQNFYDWAINNGYKPELSIDRIDNNGDYCPKNCRWANSKTQARNSRTGHFLTYNGETHCLIEWAEKLNIPVSRLRWRYQHGWTTEQILTKTTRR